MYLSGIHASGMPVAGVLTSDCNENQEWTMRPPAVNQA